MTQHQLIMYQPAPSTVSIAAVNSSTTVAGVQGA